MLRTALLSLVLITACSKKDDKSTAGGTAAPAAAEKTTEPAPKAGAPVKTTPTALFDEFTKPGVDGMALLDKYHDGATISGKVSVKGHEEDGKPILWIELDGGRHIDLGYKDVEKAKAVKDGDTVTVTCQVGGAMDKLMQVIDCV
ncbi:MAG: hypothetical protein JO257_29050 [Deltaproteobacteria bacterium]|nr:hypothetical protein [Deltaproteobacteria bacterium]